MKISMKTSALVSATVCALSLSTFASAQTYLLDMKGPGSGNPFWAAVQKGAEDAGKANNVKVLVMSPLFISKMEKTLYEIAAYIQQQALLASNGTSPGTSDNGLYGLTPDSRSPTH